MIADPFGGGSADWARGVANITYSYLIELRDRKVAGSNRHYGFVLPPDEILPTAEENWAGLKVVATDIIHNYGGVPAPVVSRRDYRVDEPLTEAPIDITIFVANAGACVHEYSLSAVILITCALLVL